MICKNVHNHIIDIYVFKNKVWSKIYEIPPNSPYPLYPPKLINKNSKDLYAILCRNCIEMYNDYKSYFSFKNENVFVSLFCNKSSIDNHKYNDVICFVFNEFDDSILFGTKNEIISFISRKYNSLESDNDDLRREMNSTKAQNKKSIENWK